MSSIFDKKDSDFAVVIPNDWAEETVAGMHDVPPNMLVDIQHKLIAQKHNRSELEKWGEAIKGPWAYDELSGVSDNEGSDARTGATAAQMKLIAAAPELLEALIDLYAYLQTVRKNHGYTLTQVDKAIEAALPARVAKEVLR